MDLVEKISTYLGNKIAFNLNLDKEQEAILVYGAFSFIQTLWCILIIVLFGIVFDVLLESIIISFSAAFLRKYSGGVHASSPNRCAFMGGIIFTLLAIIVHEIRMHFSFVCIFAGLSFLFSYYIIHQYAPVDSPNKPIRKEETKKRLRKSAFILLHSLLIIILFLFINYLKFKDETLFIYILSICLGILWQSLTLVPFGNFILSKLDLLLKRSLRR